MPVAKFIARVWRAAHFQLRTAKEVHVTDRLDAVRFDVLGGKMGVLLEQFRHLFTCFLTLVTSPVVFEQIQTFETYLHRREFLHSHGILFAAMNGHHALKHIIPHLQGLLQENLHGGVVLDGILADACSNDSGVRSSCWPVPGRSLGRC